MFNHRFFPYIVGGCIIVLLCVSYVGYRAYQKHVEYKAFMSDAQAFNRSIEEGHGHSSEASPHVGKVEVARKMSESNYQKESEHDKTIFVSEGSGTKIETDRPMSKEYLEIQQWVTTGETTPYIEQKLKERAESPPFADLVVQRVITPDGQIHTVWVHRDYQYEEGDQILKSQLQPPEEELLEHASIIIDDVEYDLPEEYYSIEDPYEREVYSKKFWWSVENGVSMAEVEKKVEKGELDFSLSKIEKGYIDEEVVREERHRLLLQIPKPPLSDKPPVKITFLPDEQRMQGEGALPGWARKEIGNRPLGSGEAVSDGTYSAADPFSEESVNEDTSGAPVRSDVPVSPSDLPSMVEPKSPQSVADIEKQLTPQGIEAELSGELSTNPFDKAQQLIDEYGTTEGLRRLRESDPEAARRFERERRGTPGRDAPDGGQSAQ